jgi:hypothetical protein
VNRRVPLILAGAAVAIAALLWLLLAARPPVGMDGNLVEVLDLPTPTPAPQQQVVLLFAGRDNLLYPELRSVALPDDLSARIRVLLGELLAGPRGELAPVVPYPAEVMAVFVDRQRNAYISLTEPPQPLEGSAIELLLTYGVVDTVLLNCPELAAVQLLFGGAEVPTLTGHLDLSRPLPLNKRWIAAS